MFYYFHYENLRKTEIVTSFHRKLHEFLRKKLGNILLAMPERGLIFKDKKNKFS